jgi:hypothetical protein
LPDIVPDVIQDAHLYRSHEFRQQFVAAELHVDRMYPLQPLPMLSERILRNLTPSPLYRLYQVRTGRSMGLGCVARRTKRPSR